MNVSILRYKVLAMQTRIYARLLESNARPDSCELSDRVTPRRGTDAGDLHDKIVSDQEVDERYPNPRANRSGKATDETGSPKINRP